jgi:hypothetical protein
MFLKDYLEDEKAARWAMYGEDRTPEEVDQMLAALRMAANPPPEFKPAIKYAGFCLGNKRAPSGY